MDHFYLSFIYLRYIDDVYAIFDSNQNCDVFLPLFNTQHQNAKFAVEKTTDLQPFLDVEIKFDAFGFKTSVWRKLIIPTGLLVIFDQLVQMLGNMA